MHTKHLSAILLITSVMISGCSNRNPDTQTLADENRNDTSVTCSGYVVIEPENESTIPSPAAGRITSVLVQPGQEVRAGQHVAIMENTDFVVIQQEFLEARNILDFYRQEYARQGDLTVENATSMKKMQAAKRDYQSAEIKFQSLHKQLTVMGLSPDSLKPEGLNATLSVKTNRSGIISDVFVNPGSYVEKGEQLFGVVKKQSVIIRLQVPEESFMRVHEGQAVECRPVMDSLKVMSATIRSVSQEIDPASRTVTVFAEPGITDLRIIPGMSVKAAIQVD